MSAATARPARPPENPSNRAPIRPRDPDWLSWFFLSFGATTGLIAVGYLALWAAYGWG